MHDTPMIGRRPGFAVVAPAPRPRGRLLSDHARTWLRYWGWLALEAAAIVSAICGGALLMLAAGRLLHG